MAHLRVIQEEAWNIDKSFLNAIDTGCARLGLRRFGTERLAGTRQQNGTAYGNGQTYQHRWSAKQSAHVSLRRESNPASLNSAIGKNAIFGMILAMRTMVLALDRVFDLGISAVLDVFQTANELIEMAELSVPRFETGIVGVRRTVKTSQGLHVPVKPIDARPPDCIVVPAIGFKMPGPLEGALARPDIRDATLALQEWANQGATITAACIGTFVLAESGLLDHQHATTTWWLAPFFRQRYPSVLLDESNMIVKSGRLITAGAALSHMDLALWLVRSVSPRLASLTAKYLIADSRTSQSVYALTDHLIHADPVVERFETWARGRLRHGFSLDAAAKAVGASKRTLARRMQRVLGKSPLDYFQSLRIERAVHLLRTCDASVDEVAVRVGYADGTTLRTLLRQRLKIGVREIRRAE
jgi:transcriptional regulator GlxA family with amidase domain